jgi:hypothetical protein
MKITRDVVTDLWPLYLSSEASADTRALVDEFLRQDPEFARLIRANKTAEILEPIPMVVAPDLEMMAFIKTRKAFFHRLPGFLFFAMLFSCMAFGRIVSDTSWDVSPRNFAITAAIAGVFWIAFLVQLVRQLKRLR